MIAGISDSKGLHNYDKPIECIKTEENRVFLNCLLN